MRASLSKNACIGFSEFNELNECLNRSLRGKEEGAFVGNIRKIDLTTGADFLRKKQDLVERSLRWCPPSLRSFRRRSSYGGQDGGEQVATGERIQGR
jgi:hypothetical protein